MPTVDLHRTEIAYNVGDPFMERVNRDLLLTFINRAATDLVNSGWLLPQEHSEGTELLDNEYEYDVPARFAYIKEIRLGDKSVGNADTVDTGTELGAAIADTTTTSVTVDDGTIFAVNDLIQVDDEIMLVTAISSNTLTVTRGYFSTTAATHSDGASILRPLSDIVYDYIVPRAYWRLKLQTGGANTTTAAMGSRPQLIFHSGYFSFTASTPLQVIGQRRPTSVYANTDTLDSQMESFIVERATAYAARFLYAQGGAPHLDNVYRESMATSEQFLRLHPSEFRVKPSSTRVPGR
jgi:hypothetical protein